MVEINHPGATKTKLLGKLLLLLINRQFTAMRVVEATRLHTAGYQTVTALLDRKAVGL
jgi:hypothetical protein